MSSESPSPDRNGTVDLFNALLVASRFLGGSPANRAILRDLPLEQGKLTTTHIAAAAAKLDLTVTTVPASLARLRTPYALPSILVPKKPHARAITLVKKNRRGFHGCFSPQSPTFFVPNKAIAAHSHALLLKPNFVLDQRSALLDFPDTVAWLRVPLMRNSPVYGLAVLASLCINLFAVAITFFVMAVYDRVTPNNSIESLIVLVAGISTVLVFDFTMKMLRAYMIDRAGQRFDITVGAGIFRKLLALRSVARPHSAGATANLVREFDSVRDFFTSATLVTLADLPFLLMFVGIIWLIGGKIVIVVLVAIPLVLLASLLLHWRLRPLIRENFRDGAQKSAFLHEIAVGIDSVKLANAQGWARRRYEALTLSASQSSLRTRLYSQGSTHFTALCVSGVTVGVVSVGALQIIAGELTVGALIASTMLSSRAMAPLTQISSLMAKWNHTRTAVKALDDLMSAETEHDASPLSGFITRDMVEGDIKLVGVDFAYPSHTGRSISSEGRGHSLFENLSLHITAGESIGVLGRIGSGKTTLLHLMSNLHQPSKGHVLLDDVDVRHSDPSDLRRHVGYVSQNGALFYGTIRDNILLGDSWIPNERVINLARDIGLARMLQGSSLGIFTPVGERGEFLSGGQRQAVLLARALIHEPSLLLLDEPTANMDSTTEAMVINYLAKWRERRTLVFVTHRPNLISITDRVLVMDQGKIILDDSRDAVARRLAKDRDS